MSEHCLDFERSGRCGFPEFIYGAGKTPEQLIAIFTAFEERGTPALATRVSETVAQKVMPHLTSPVYDPLGKILIASSARVTPPTRTERIVIVSAGTSDTATVAECAGVLRFCGWEPIILNDVGVAGIHRLMAHVETLRSADTVIAVAGMEGALPSVVGGLVASPVIAVPTSVGYGAARDGETALMAMLSSCASGITVVNIDNGFGAACAAMRILRKK